MSSRFCHGCSTTAKEEAIERGADSLQAQDCCKIAYLSRCAVSMGGDVEYWATFIGDNHQKKWLPAKIIDPYLIFQYHCYHVRFCC